MHLPVKHIIIFISFLLICSNLVGQTCCTAGAPVSTYLGIQNKTEKAFSLQIAYEFNSINLLISDNTRLENDPRSRSGQNISVKADYTLNSKIAFSTILPVVQQSRSTFSESQSSIGIGDLILLTEYSPINDRFKSLNFSAGIKLPTGQTNNRGGSSILLSPDMQSGSGSVDFQTSSGSRITLDGSVSGESQLVQAESFIGFYFSLAAFYDVEIYE